MQNRIPRFAAMAAGLVTAAATAASAQYTAGDQWVRAADFMPGTHGSNELNPGPGFDGVPVWKYELATGGGGLGSTSPWYRQPTTTMTWDSDWYGIGQGAWTAGDDVNPPVFQNRMTHNIINDHYDRVPVVRWQNPNDDNLRVAVSGQYNVLWTGHEFVGDDVDVELVVAHERGATGDVAVLFSTTVGKPTPGLSIGDSIDVPVDLSMVHLAEGDSLIFSGRATERKSGLGRWIAIQDQLKVEVVPVPAPGALALLGAAGLAATRRRRG